MTTMMSDAATLAWALAMAGHIAFLPRVRFASQRINPNCPSIPKIDPSDVKGERQVPKRSARPPCSAQGPRISYGGLLHFLFPPRHPLCHTAPAAHPYTPDRERASY